MVDSVSSFKVFRRLGLALAAALLPALSLAWGVGARGSERPAAPPSELTVNGRSAPVDLDVTPRFGWQGRSIEQSAYELRVASSRAAAEAGATDVWTSGKVSSSEQTAVRYEGPPLEPSERYFWSVRTWGGGTGASAWSPVAAFGTGPGTSWSRSVPIWTTAASTGWSDYTLEAEVVIDEVALGVRFRASSPSDGYMWQFRGSDNRLVPHRIVDGTFSVLESVSLPPDTLALGRPATVRIDARGSTIDTFIDGVLVHSLQDATFSSGGVGVRTGNSESGRVTSLSLLDPSGSVLLQTDFDARDRTFGCGSVRDGALAVPRASHCLQAGLAVDWALLRKPFTPRDVPIAWATAFATGASPLPARQYVYKLYLDGHFVGLGPTQSLGGETRYDGFDVTGLLEPGRPSALGVLAYAPSGRAFQAELVVTYVDGSRDVIGTDGTWRAISGDHALPAAGSIGTSYYAAPRENLDARSFPSGFDTPGFDDGAWSGASEQPPLGALAAAPMNKVVEQLHAPTQIVELGPGHYFIDFGRAWVGGVKYDIDAGRDGASVEVRFGEVTSAPNTVRHQLQAGNTYQDVFTQRDGPQTFQTWGMRVFRYVEIIGAPEPITADHLSALALVYPWSGAAPTFTASDPNLESVWQLSRNTIEAVNVNFFTDSWTRERTNYEADAYLQLLSSLYLVGDLSLGRYSIDYFGSHRTWPTEWPLYVILAAHDAWLHSGDSQQLVDGYDSLRAKLPEAWLEPSTGLIRKAIGSNGCNSTTDCDIVDWPESQRDGFVFREYNTVVNALSYRAYRDMAEIAAAVGEEDDASLFDERAAVLRDAINTRLYAPDAGRYDDGMDGSGALTGHASLHASAFALAFGVPDAAEAPPVADFLAARGMACSVYCAPFLTSGLYRAGRDRAALDLLSSTSLTSWMNMIRLGAGATAEAWDPSLKNNLTYSHPWAASPAFSIPSGLFGIEPLEPGFATFRVEPRPGGLEHASVTIPTVRGTIGAAFAHGPSGALELAIQVPSNTRARVSIPVPAGTTTLYVDDAPVAIEPRATIAPAPELGAGCHILSPEAERAAHPDETLLRVCSSPPVLARDEPRPDQQEPVGPACSGLPWPRP
jgi:alpha-L-rhamnosidase